MSNELLGVDGPEWLRSDGADSDVVMSSRVRLARNIAGFPFLSKASDEDRRQVMELVRERVLAGGVAENLLWVDVTEASDEERHLLVERHLISRQHARGSGARGAAISAPDERLSIMVNEEDHLRIQVIRAGLAVADAMTQIDAVDDAIEGQIGYAFNPRFGYLTACPTNVGTGMRVSVMLHLPGLRMTGEIEKVRRAAKSLNLAVRGFYGEGSEASGDLFQISNQTTLGKTERRIVRDFESAILPRVLEYERKSRHALLTKSRMKIVDRSHRALGVLRSARLMTAEEALKLISRVRMGVLLGVVEGVDLSTLNRLILLTQPAHLQRAVKANLNQAERRVVRADLCRDRLGGE
ncbi:MAG: protein arginine kinase [Phycisphaeraceae bacterium]|nr:protein arginine kinase [Phycisphaeraceae bacterium]MCB9848136.1 protein arginine kinase [Phycisphaeraceae bacterium]